MDHLRLTVSPRGRLHAFLEDGCSPSLNGIRVSGGSLSLPVGTHVMTLGSSLLLLFTRSFLRFACRW